MESYYKYFEFCGKPVERKFHIYECAGPEDQEFQGLITSHPFIGLVAFGQKVIHITNYRDSRENEVYRVIITRDAEGRERRHIGYRVLWKNPDMYAWNREMQRVCITLWDDIPNEIRPIRLYNEHDIRRQVVRFVVEDERDVDALKEFGVIATTHPYGLKGMPDNSVLRLVGRRVAILPGNTAEKLAIASDLARRVREIDPNVTVLSMPYEDGQRTVHDYLKQRWLPFEANGMAKQAFAEWLTVTAIQSPRWGEVVAV